MKHKCARCDEVFKWLKCPAPDCGDLLEPIELKRLDTLLERAEKLGVALQVGGKIEAFCNLLEKELELFEYRQSKNKTTVS